MPTLTFNAPLAGLLGQNTDDYSVGFFNEHLTENLAKALTTIQSQIEYSGSPYCSPLHNVQAINNKLPFFTKANAYVMSKSGMSVQDLSIVMGIIAAAFTLLLTLKDSANATDAYYQQQRKENILSGACKWVYQGCKTTRYRTHRVNGKTHSSPYTHHYNCHAPQVPGAICDDQVTHYSFYLYLVFTALISFAGYLLCKGQENIRNVNNLPKELLGSELDNTLNTWCDHNGYERPDDWNEKRIIKGETFSLKEYVISILLKADVNEYIQEIENGEIFPEHLELYL